MDTYDKSYSNKSLNYRYNLAFKTTLETHSQVQEIASQSGNSMSDTCRNLLDLGIESHNEKNPSARDKPKIRLFSDLRKVRDREHILNTLAQLKGELKYNEFQAHCSRLGIDPTDVDEISPPGGGKSDRLAAFLRVLFTDRPTGLPVNRVLEIAKREGFGENMTRDVARKLGFPHVWETSNGTRTSFWKSPPDW